MIALKQKPPPLAIESVSSPERGASGAKIRAVFRFVPVLLVLIALAHAQSGMEATGGEHLAQTVGLASFVWTVSSVGFAAAGLGVAGFSFARNRWRGLLAVAALCGLLLTGIAGWDRHYALAIVDLAAFTVALYASDALPESRRSGFGHWIGALFLLYLGTVSVLYPWSIHWGATRPEVARSYPGEEEIADRRFLVDHAVTVNAPPERIWPYLVQLGQDKAGFYSYDLLERAFGLRIRNVSEIRPEWQNLRKGDFVRACPEDWLGGGMKEITGWRVAELEPNRMLVLEHWGAFWLEPQADGITRFGVRSQIGAVPAFYAPIHAYLFTPAHFIMEQRMLRTIRDLAER